MNDVLGYRVKPLPELAGIVDMIHSNSYDVNVQIFQAARSGIDAGGHRYAVVCGAHGNILGIGDLDLARDAALYPAVFCQGCQVGHPTTRGLLAVARKLVGAFGLQEIAEPDSWRLEGLIGSWHHVSGRRAFRLYRRRNQRDEVWFFADYRLDDLVTRHHKLFPFEEGTAKSWSAANTTALDASREELIAL